MINQLDGKTMKALLIVQNISYISVQLGIGSIVFLGAVFVV